MYRTIPFLVFWLLLSSGCMAQPVLKQGIWRAEFQLNDSIALPVRIEVTDDAVVVMNAEERIAITELSQGGDSLFWQMPVFNSRIHARIYNDSLRGSFLNGTRLNKNVIPFRARYGWQEPMVNDFELKDFSGKWAVRFAGDEPPLDKSIGIFKQQGNRVTGTFLTPTGDYRYLEGYAGGSRFYVAAFDGSHLFYIDGTMDASGNLAGNFYSGAHGYDTWTAKRNEQAELPNPDSLTFLKPGYERLDFAFPDEDSNVVSLADEKFKNKVVLVQIMGTWCPNCMDETAFLAPFYDKRRDEGLEIIGLDYERVTAMPVVKKNLARLRKQYNINYTLLFAGSTDRDKREKTLPQLTAILSFPTTIYIDRKGRVRKIHTGFNGPATGAAYEKWKDSFEKFVNMLLAEKGY